MFCRILANPIFMDLVKNATCGFRVQNVSSFISSVQVEHPIPERRRSLHVILDVMTTRTIATLIPISHKFSMQDNPLLGTGVIYKMERHLTITFFSIVSLPLSSVNIPNFRLLQDFELRIDSRLIVAPSFGSENENYYDVYKILPDNLEVDDLGPESALDLG